MTTAARHRIAVRRPVPRRTVRLRLTLLYGILFLGSGAALLAITYGLAASQLSSNLLSQGPGGSTTSSGPVTAPPAVADSTRAQQAADLHLFLIQSGIALAIMAAAALALGWLTAGRTLRPLRDITAATRRISDRNLHERLALAGPCDELTDLADTIDGLLARMDAAFGSQRRFVANASHECAPRLCSPRRCFKWPWPTRRSRLAHCGPHARTSWPPARNRTGSSRPCSTSPAASAASTTGNPST